MLKRHKSTISREVGHNRGGASRLPPPCRQPCPHAHLSDNGKEFFHHQVVAEGAQRRWPLRSPLPFLRARAQREHQRTHSPIPAPKGTDFQTLTHKEVQGIMDKLNNRPRKCLGFKTPNQVFFGIKPPIALVS